jgi:hypothetical protein
MSDEIIDTLMALVIIVAVEFLTFYVGYEMSERKNCKLNKGHYSFDYGECFKNGELK